MDLWSQRNTCTCSSFDCNNHAIITAFFIQTISEEDIKRIQSVLSTEEGQQILQQTPLTGLHPAASAKSLSPATDDPSSAAKSETTMDSEPDSNDMAIDTKGDEDDMQFTLEENLDLDLTASEFLKVVKRFGDSWFS